MPCGFAWQATFVGKVLFDDQDRTKHIDDRDYCSTNGKPRNDQAETGMENDLIRWLRDRVPGHPLVRVGLGDDGAVLDLKGAAESVISVDLLSDGVDFVLTAAGGRRVGRKALAVNLSDLAAMAARPICAVVALLLPRNGGLSIAKEMYEGMLPLAEQHNVALAGGDTNSWDGPLVVSVTVLGATIPPGPLRRAGAIPGDLLAVTGPLGGSILGRHLDFEPRVAEALRLRAAVELHAGIDISDGLALDLSRLCEESGCGANLWAERIPIHPDAVRLATENSDGRGPLDHALSDGEDFELLLALPRGVVEATEADGASARAIRADASIHRPGAKGIVDDGEPPGTIRISDVPLSIIGECTAERGMRLIYGDGRVESLEPRGWQHQLEG